MRTFFFTFVVLFLVFLMSFSSKAQVPSWAHTWGGSNDDEGYCVAFDRNGNIYLAGYTRSFGAGLSDVLLVKYDSSGNLLWQKTWGGSKEDWGIAVAVDTSGNVYVAGGTKSFGAGWSDAFVLKVDSTGSLIWNRTWGGSSYEVAYDISFDNSGNIYLAAETYSYGNAGAAAVLKFNSNGDFLWSRTWDGPGPGTVYDETNSIEVDPDGNIYLTGRSWYYWPEVIEILLLKFDSSGNLLWSKRWGGSGRDESPHPPNNMILDNNGNLYVGGKTEFGAGGDDILLLKFDSYGNLIWSRTWGGTGYESAYGLSLGRDGHIYVAGETGSFGTGEDVLLLEYDSSGSLLSQKTWGDSSDQTAYSIVIDEPGNIFLGGSAANNSGSWQDVTGTTGTPTGALSSPSGTVGSPAGVISSPTATITTPSGVIDTGGGGADVLVLKYVQLAHEICNAFLTAKKVNVGPGDAAKPSPGSGNAQVKHDFKIHIIPCEPMDVSVGDSADVFVDADKSGTFDEDENYLAIVSSTDLDSQATDIAIKVYIGEDLINNDPCVAIYSINNIPIVDTLGNPIDYLCLNTFDPHDPYDGNKSQVSEFPENVTLMQNYPNPFNPMCEIEYALSTDCQVTLSIYNILGQKVRVLVDEYQDGGFKSVKWDGKDDQGQEVASGVYFYRLQAKDFVQAKKMLLLR